MYHRIAFLFVGLFVCVACHADPLEELQSFTDFKGVDLKRLASGDILTLRGGSMAFSRGISAQTCFFVQAPAKTTAEAIPTWNSSQHESLGVYQHCTIQSPPKNSDFDPLSLHFDKSPIRWLVNKTLAAKADRFELQISRTDAALIVGETQGQPTSADLASKSWKKILMSRATSFQRDGIANLPPYEMGDSPIKTAAEIRSLLKENPRIISRFSQLLTEANLVDGALASGTRTVPQCYWELFTVEDHAALNLGAIYLKSLNDHYQVLDCGYYVSNGYYASLVLFEVWPVEGGSLVWRADLLSAPSIAATKGIDRMAYGKIMILEIKKAIQFFREDMRKAAKGRP